MHRKRNTIFEKIARKVTEVAGTSFAFVFACILILVWADYGTCF